VTLLHIEGFALAVGRLRLEAWSRFVSAVVPSARRQSCEPTPPGITAWWPAEGYANDIASYHYGTLHGGVSFVPSVVCQAFNFDGATGYVEVPSSPGLQPPSAISITAWVYPTAFSSDPYRGTAIVTKYDSFDVSAGVSWSLGVGSAGQIEWVLYDAQTKRL
jgi:Concanavalin A-like lectin/glucanases superfamily